MSRARLCAFALALTFVMSVSSPSRSWSTTDGTWNAPDPPSAPGARREYAAVYDRVNRRYVLFAGADDRAPSLSSLHSEIYTLSLDGSPVWALEDAGPGPGARHSPQIGYDPARNRLLMFGGYGFHYPGGPAEYLNDIWELELDGTPTWHELFPLGAAPSGRLAGAAVYDPRRQRFVGFGGTIGVPVDTWELDLSVVPLWQTVPTDSTGPAGGYGMAAVYDNRRDRMITFGGSTSDAYFGTHNDTWALDLTDDVPTWHKLSPEGNPPIARRTMAAVFDPVRDRMVIYGGWDGTPSLNAFLHDTWALSLDETPQWNELLPDGTMPTQRDAVTAAYDPGNDRMVFFGGWSGDYMLGDTQFLEWGDQGTAASMTATGGANPGSVNLQWSLQNVTGPHSAVYRRQANTSWTSIATVESNAGQVSFQDATVVAGQRYGYMIAVSSQQGEDFGGEAWVDVPTTNSVGSGAAFALNRVSPNPVVDRFSVSFSLPSAAPARLELIDLAGRRVFSKDVGSLGAGSHHLEIDGAHSFAPGMYFLRLAQSGQMLSSRVVIAQ